MLAQERRSQADGHYYPWANPRNTAEDRRLALRIRAHIIGNFADEELERNSCTSLGEMVAHEMGHDEWLDDDTHILWDVCSDIYDYLDLTAQ